MIVTSSQRLDKRISPIYNVTNLEDQNYQIKNRVYSPATTSFSDAKTRGQGEVGSVTNKTKLANNNYINRRKKHLALINPIGHIMQEGR